MRRDLTHGHELSGPLGSANDFKYLVLKLFSLLLVWGRFWGVTVAEGLRSATDERTEPPFLTLLLHNTTYGRILNFARKRADEILTPSGVCRDWLI